MQLFKMVVNIMTRYNIHRGLDIVQPLNQLWKDLKPNFEKYDS